MALEPLGASSPTTQLSQLATGLVGPDLLVCDRPQEFAYPEATRVASGLSRREDMVRPNALEWFPKVSLLLVTRIQTLPQQVLEED